MEERDLYALSCVLELNLFPGGPFFSCFISLRFLCVCV